MNDLGSNRVAPSESSQAHGPMKNKEEKVEYYDGGILRTNKGEYGLAFGELKFRKKK